MECGGKNVGLVGSILILVLFWVSELVFRKLFNFWRLVFRFFYEGVGLGDVGYLIVFGILVLKVRYCNIYFRIIFVVCRKCSFSVT